MARLSEKVVKAAIQEMLEEGQLTENPLDYISRAGDGQVRYCFKKYTAVGARAALAYLNTLANEEHMGSFAPKNSKEESS